MMKKVICSVNRGELEESQHEISCVVINNKNKIIFQSGNPEKHYCLRSTLKPFQAAASLEHETDKKYKLSKIHISGIYFTDKIGSGIFLSEISFFKPIFKSILLKPFILPILGADFFVFNRFYQPKKNTGGHPSISGPVFFYSQNWLKKNLKKN